MYHNLCVHCRLDDIRAARLAGNPQEDAAIMLQARDLAGAKGTSKAVRGGKAGRGRGKGRSAAASPPGKGEHAAMMLQLLHQGTPRWPGGRSHHAAGA